MNAAALVLWSIVAVTALAAVALLVVALRTKRAVLAYPAVVPVALGVVLLAAGVGVDPGTPVLPLVLSLALAALGVLGGSPFARAVLERTAPPEEHEGAYGGILVRQEGVADAPPREVLRGGSVIGYLERAAVVGAIAVGHPEVLAAVIAIKGLGRFSELDSSEARERFIIGTLVSLIWSSLCGAIIWLGRA